MSYHVIRLSKFKSLSKKREERSIWNKFLSSHNRSLVSQWSSFSCRLIRPFWFMTLSSFTPLGLMLFIVIHCRCGTMVTIYITDKFPHPLTSSLTSTANPSACPVTPAAWSRINLDFFFNIHTTIMYIKHEKYSCCVHIFILHSNWSIIGSVTFLMFVGWSFSHNFLKGWEVTLLCSYRSTCLFTQILYGTANSLTTYILYYSTPVLIFILQLQAV